MPPLSYGNTCCFWLAGEPHVESTLQGRALQVALQARPRTVGSRGASRRRGALSVGLPVQQPIEWALCSEMCSHSLRPCLDCWSHSSDFLPCVSV